MRSAILLRESTSDQGTFGQFILDNGKSWCSGELPQRDNACGVSCIPAGRYVCKWITSPKHGKCYQITGVAGRSMIEIHSANFMGDASKGLASQLLGCVALGKAVGMLEVKRGMSQLALLTPRQAVGEFEAELCGEDFMLEIKEKKNG